MKWAQTVTLKHDPRTGASRMQVEGGIQSRELLNLLVGAVVWTLKKAYGADAAGKGYDEFMDALRRGLGDKK